MKQPSIFIILLCFLFLAIVTRGQVNLSLRAPNNLRPAIEKVLSSYSDHYSQVKGDTLSVTGTSIVYASVVKPTSAENCILTEYLNTEKYDYSWEAMVLNTDDFEAAAKKYNTCCQQLKNMTVKTGGETSKMEGEYEPPEGTKNFYSTVFSASAESPLLQKLRVEVLMESDLTSWKIRILVYDRVHEDKEGNM